MRLRTAFLLPLLLFCGPANAQKLVVNKAELPVHVVGRIAADGRQQWPGVYYEAAFDGDHVDIAFTDKANIFNLYVDGTFVRQVQRGQGTFSVAAKAPGRHIVRLEKASESQDSANGPSVKFFVVSIRSAAITQVNTPLPPPPARTRQIEFIGDSWTVGYGNTSAKRTCTKDEIWATTDTSQAFGPLTAKHFDADYQINAYSGRGVVRNYDGVAPGVPLPALYPYELFDRKTAYSDPAWHPQLIVVGLGGNDFSTPLHPTEKWATREALAADYEASYVAFLKNVRARNPKAYLLIESYKASEAGPHIDNVVAKLKAEGETRIDSVMIGDFELTGCDWHLNVKDDQKISAQMTAWIDAHPDIWLAK